MKPWKIITSALVLGTLSSAAVPPAIAAPLMPAAGSERLAASGQPVTEVQYRRGFRGPHGHYHGGYGHRGGGGGGAALIGGLAAGALIGGAIASSQAQAQANQAAAYCAQRFRSYDPASGTYLATDGYRRPCP